jgi:hypothetical protein
MEVLGDRNGRNEAPLREGRNRRGEAALRGRSWTGARRASWLGVGARTGALQGGSTCIPGACRCRVGKIAGEERETGEEGEREAVVAATGRGGGSGGFQEK